jgi:hypothetical protein
MAEYEEMDRKLRQRKWEESQAEAQRIASENAERERRRHKELQSKWESERAEAEAQRQRARIQREREARAKHFNLQIRNVHFERKGDHDIWSTGHRSRRMVHGICTTPTITSNNHSRSSAGCKIEFPIPLLCAHEPHGSIGEVVTLRRSPREIYCICALHDDNPAADYAWSLVEQGELRAFSVASAKGSSTVAGSVLGTKFYGSWQLSEVSLCRVGANPDCNSVEIFSRRRKVL